jgi:hypothetical protein
MPFGTKAVTQGQAVTHAGMACVSKTTLDIDFDDIWRLLIKPALVRAGCRPYRADDEIKAGDIRTDMYFELVTGEFVLADISTLNANVFYELGVRHGVSPRGVIMIDGGWDKRPFDVAPDRTFTYGGALFDPQRERDAGWEAELDLEVELLGARLGTAIANDASTTSSPVYKELTGLKPVDWTRIQNTKARYFGGQLHDWHARVRKAKRQSLVGDILTLARDAPNRLIEWQLRLDATRALFDLGRFERANELLRAMVNENPECPETRYALAKTLHRLADKATMPEERRKFNALVENEIEEAIRRGGDDPEAHRLLGRIYKYRWRNRWQHESSLEDRQRLALEHWKTGERALSHYQEAQTRDLRFFHAGINVISLLRLAAHLNDPDSPKYTLDPDLVGLIKTAARQSLARGQQITAAEQDASDAIWANAVLGEVALLTGQFDAANNFFHRAATDPDVSVSQLVSFDDQLRMYELLGFATATVAQIRQQLTTQLDFQQHKRLGTREIATNGDSVGQVLVFRGESFAGREIEQAVAERIEALLDRWHIGTGDLVVCGARRGAEILFATACRQRNADVRLLLPIKKSDFVAAAVRSEAADWEARFYTLADRCEMIEQQLRLGPAPVQLDPYERNNHWCLEIARTEYGPATRPRVVSLSVGNGDLDPINQRGSLQHFEHCACALDLPVEKIFVSSPGTDPTQFFWAFGTLLHIRQPNGDVLEEPFREALRIGRAEDNHLVLNDRSISRYHLSLEPDAEGARVKNISRHPRTTFLDGEALPPDPERSVLVTFAQTLTLVDGTTIKITREPASATEVQSV